MMSSLKGKDKNQHIQVFVRVRPVTRDENSSNVVDIRGPKDLSIRHHSTNRNYTFDRVFGPNSKQSEVFKLVVEPTVAEVIAGYNCTVLAYGQTGTGKTYTMVGGNASEANSASKVSWCEDLHCGIIPRTLSRMFDELRMQQLQYSVRVSYLELYNEEIFDLLSPVEDNSKLKMYDDNLKKGSVIVQGLTECTVNSKTEVYRILEKGAEKRRIASTLINAQSSRSHTVFCITVHTKESSVDGEDLLNTGKLYLVDLAGSENIKQSGATDLRAREAFNINQSLLTLGRCIVKLMERSAHIPFRESKLTRLLQDSLGGRTKTTLIATVSPAFCNADETINTLDYASRAKCITTKPEINQRLSKNALIKEYTVEIERLKKDLLAARMGKGVYLDKDNYDNILKELDCQREEIVQKIRMIKVTGEEMERMKATCNDLEITLTQRQQDVLLKTEAIYSLETKLEEASKTIHDLNEENEVKEFIVQAHSKTEKLLQDTTRKLITVADTATSDTEKLHNKLDTISELNKQNKIACEQRITEFNGTINQIQNRLNEFHHKGRILHRHMFHLLDVFEKNQEEYKKVRYTYFADVKNILQSHVAFCKADTDAITQLTVQLTEADSKVSVSADSQNALCAKYSQEFVHAISKLNDYINIQQDLTAEAMMCFKMAGEEYMTNTMSFIKVVKDILNNSKVILALQLRKQKNMSLYTEEKLTEYSATQRNIQRQSDEELENAIKALTHLKTLSTLYSSTTNEQHNKYDELVKETFKAMSDNTTQIKSMSDETVEVFDNYSVALETNKSSKFAHYVSLEQRNNNTFKDTCSSTADLNKNLQAHNEEIAKTMLSIRDKYQLQFEHQQSLLRNTLAERSIYLGDLEESINIVGIKMQSNSKRIIDETKTNIRDMNQMLRKEDHYRSQHERYLCTKLEKCRENFKKLFSHEIKEYKQTGTTPIRKRYKYPRTIPETMPREHIIAEYKRQRASSASRLSSPTKLHKLKRASSESDINKQERVSDENKSDGQNNN